MKLTIKLKKNVDINAQAEECIRALKNKIRKCFMRVTSKERHVRSLEFRPVENQPHLTRIFRPVTHRDDMDILEAVLWVYCFLIDNLQKNEISETLVKRVFEIDTVRNVWPDYNSLADSIRHEEVELSKYFEIYGNKYKVKLELTPSRRRPTEKPADKEPPVNPNGDLFSTGPVPNDGQDHSNGPGPDIEKPLVGGKLPKDPPQIVRWPRKPLYGYIHRLGCRPGVRSEIVTMRTTEEKPLRLLLDRKSVQQVKENPEFFIKRFLQFTFDPMHDDLASIVIIQKGDAS